MGGALAQASLIFPIKERFMFENITIEHVLGVVVIIYVVLMLRASVRR